MKKSTLLSVAIASITLFANCGISNDKKDKEVITPVKEVSPAAAEATSAAAVAEEEVSLPSGLKYKVLKHGNGTVTPKPKQKVTVHYTGWLDNNGDLGKKFDSSVDRGQKFIFTIGVGRVIRGWDEGVMGMKVGDKRRLTIPPHLAYGDRGAGRSIPPRATLIFDVELFNIG